MVYSYVINNYGPANILLMHPSRVQLSAYKYPKFTRQGFADILRTLGPIVDAWIPQPSPANNSNNNDCLNYKLDIRIHESEARRQWWLDCMKQCFPTCVRLKRLHIDFRARKCLKSCKCHFFEFTNACYEQRWMSIPDGVMGAPTKRACQRKQIVF